MMRLIACARLGTAALVLAVALTGCGGDEKKAADEPASNGVAEMEPPQALRAALKAHRGLKDVVYTGRMLDSFPIGARTMDITVTATARGCQREASDPELGRLTSRLLKGTRYWKGSDTAMTELLEVPPSAVDLIDNRWISEPITGDVACSPVETVTDDIDIASCMQGGQGEVDGTPVVTVRCPRSGVEWRFHVSTTGAPLILRLEPLGTSDHGLTLVDVDSGVRIEAPPKRDVIDSTAFE